jgi:hypothetical protein
VLRLLAKNPVGYFSNPAFYWAKAIILPFPALAQSRDAVTVPGDNFRHRHRHHAKLNCPKLCRKLCRLCFGDYRFPVFYLVKRV